MQVEVIDLMWIGFGLALLYLAWENVSLDRDMDTLTNQLNHMIEQHNNLCEVVEELARDVEKEMNELAHLLLKEDHKND